MIRLTYAHRWTHLVDALAEHLVDVRRDLGPLEPLTVVVPHAVATAHLKLALAERLGIAANLRTVYLRPFVTEAYEAGGRVRVLTPARLFHLLLVALEDVDDPELLPVRRYLRGDGPADRRRAQLAQTLTGLFDDYGLTRPETLDDWRAGWRGDDAAPNDTARWQAALWRRVRALADELDGPPLATLAELVGHPAAVPRALFVFDVVLGAPVLQGVLASWADAARIELYAVNPCMEFWEDLPAGGRAARSVRARLLPARGGEWSDLADQDDPLALVLWGRPGRENIRQLNQLTDCDFDGRFGTPAAATSTLDHLQQDILHRAPPAFANEPAPSDDDSVVVLACPGARREAEVIAESIWARVAATAASDRPLAFNEVGIVLAGRDRDAYRSHFAAVFEEYHQVPHHFLDVPVAPQSRVIEAFELLLDLPASRFTRQDILRLATHPCVGPDDDSATADEWVAWCRDLAVVHGADREDHADTYIEADLLNWDQGLTRLTLGQFIAGEDDDEPVFYSSDDGRRFLPYNAPFDRADSAADFVTLARSLIADARFIRQAVLPMRDWAQLFRTALSAYVAPRDDADERDLLRILGVLDKLEDEDLTGRPLAFALVETPLRAALADLTENQGQPLADGVVVAPLRLAANLPLRVVYLPGLHEGAFPTPDQPSSLDVRRFERRPGEIRPRERDQYQFLGRLLATTDQVVVSYVARDAGTGDARAPAPTVVELIRILAAYVGPAPESRLVRAPPLRRYDGPPHPFASEPALREVESRQLRAALVGTGTPGETVGAPSGAERDARGDLDVDGLRARVSPEVWSRLAPRLGLHRPPQAPPGLPDTMTLRTLRWFLEDPLQGWVHHTLGLRADEEPEDELWVVDERFRTEALQTHVLLRTVILEAAREGRPVAEVYSKHADRLEVLGLVPTGVFKRAEHERHMSVLEHWQRGLRRVFANRPAPFDPVRYGRAPGAARVARTEAAIPLAVGDGVLELRGTTQPAVDHPPASVILKTGRKPHAGPPVHELSGFIDHAARAASGRTEGEPYVVWTVYGEGQVTRTRFDGFARREAAAYLSGLAAELRASPHDYLLPFEAVHRAHLKGDGSAEGWAPILASVTPSKYGPLAGVPAAPPDPDAAQRIYDERFGPFYHRRHPDLEGA